MEPNILSGTFGIVIILFLFVLLILWFLLPFAVFGIKGRLDQLIDQNKQILYLLKSNNTGVTSKEDNVTNTRIEPTIKQSPQVYNTATGEMKSEQKI
jgi:hypothetical protein